MTEEDVLKPLSVAFAASIQALALGKCIRDMVLTDEQKAMIPDLYSKNIDEILNQVNLPIPDVMRQQIHDRMF